MRGDPWTKMCMQLAPMSQKLRNLMFDVGRGLKFSDITSNYQQTIEFKVLMRKEPKK